MLPAEFYSQGNASYRDVNQNRRCDVLLNPAVGDSEVLAFLGLIQADGYNPLTVLGSRFVVPPERQAAILHLVDQPEAPPGWSRCWPSPSRPASFSRRSSIGGLA